MDMSVLLNVMPAVPFFLSAARHLSFTKAAADLCVTQGAVSHRIRQLEDGLGFPLFHRFPRKLMLTGEGERLYDILQRPVWDLENEIRRIRHLGLTGTLMVHCPPSLAGTWLVPRLYDFKEQHPGVEVHLRCRNDLVDFETDSVDIAIFYGDASDSRLHIIPLMQEFVLPVCSPEYARTMHLSEKGKDGLKHCLLLHDNTPWPNSQYYDEWQRWAEHCGVEGLNVQSGYSFDRSELAAMAAENGLGVALGRRQLVSAALAGGRLVAPFKEELLATQSYHIALRREDVHRPRIVGFVNWLQSMISTPLLN